MRRVHAAVRSVSSDLTQKNTNFFEAKLVTVQEEVATRVRLEEQSKIEKIVATRVKEAKDLLKDET